MISLRSMDSVLFLLGIAFVMPEAAEEELHEAGNYTSDLEEAANDETKLAEVYKHHFAAKCGTYLAQSARYVLHFAAK